MDVLYEESAVNSNAKKGEKRYKILNTISWIVGLFALISAFAFIMQLIGVLSTLNFKPSSEEEKTALDMTRSLAFLTGMSLFFWGGIWLVLFSWKKRVNVSYDYIFVSGELRISKVFNVNKRKFLYRISSEEIIKLGDVDNGNYDRIRSDPNTKEIVCTPNSEAAEGKFFLYVHATSPAGKRLYILECREELLVNILRFVQRGTLESEYVSQEKKAQQR